VISEKKLYEKILLHYGMVNQLRQLQEECGELIVAVNHYLRGRCSEAKILEEVADVQIMLNQVKAEFSGNAINMAIKTKLAKLAKKLEEAQRGR
jgi:hypothetical protein